MIALSLLALSDGPALAASTLPKQEQPEEELTGSATYINRLPARPSAKRAPPPTSAHPTAAPKSSTAKPELGGTTSSTPSANSSANQTSTAKFDNSASTPQSTAQPSSAAPEAHPSSESSTPQTSATHPSAIPSTAPSAAPSDAQASATHPSANPSNAPSAAPADAPVSATHSSAPEGSNNPSAATLDSSSSAAQTENHPSDTKTANHSSEQPASTNNPATKEPVKKSPARITVSQSVLPLPGRLNKTPFVISNSPEIVLQSGVLMSTFNGSKFSHPGAHLNHQLEGNIDVFFHHVTNRLKADRPETLYLGMIVGNAGSNPVTITIDKAVSYATKPDAPFVPLNAVLPNDRGKIFAGPGDRVTLDMLRDHKQSGWHHSIHLKPGEFDMIYSLPMYIHDLVHPLNGRTGLINMSTDGPIYLASLSCFAKHSWLKESKPKLKDWTRVLQESPLVQPRDKVPTPPGAHGALIYGRVAGVATGSEWSGTVVTEGQHLELLKDSMISFPISTVAGGTLGTDQVQAAPMVVRYPDTAYQSHGNYGALYDLSLPLLNGTDADITAGISFQTALKDLEPASLKKSKTLQFFAQPPEQIFFRGNLEFTWTDDENREQKKLIHLVEKRGESIEPLVEIPLKPKQTKTVRVRLYYPADCTPPQVLTVTTTNRTD